MGKRLLKFSSRMVMTVVFTLCSLLAVAQDGNDTIQIGTLGSSSNYNTPYTNDYKNGTVQMIYPATSFTRAGTITALSFNSTSTTSFAGTFKIYMGVKTDATFSSATDCMPVSDLTEVHSMTSVGGASGWSFVQLTTPFSYDPANGNLVVVVTHTSSSYTSSLKYYYTSTTNAVIYRQNDNNSSYADLSSTSNYSLSTQLPCAKFVLGPVSSCEMPTSLTCSNVTGEGADFTWTMPEGSSDCQYVVAAQGADPDWDNAESVYDYSGDAVTISELNPNTQYVFYVRTDCGGEYSFAKSYSFKTNCAVLEPDNVGTISFEASEGFVSGSGNFGNSNCWNSGNLKTSSNATYLPYIKEYDTYAHTGTNSLYLNAYHSSSSDYDSAYAILPQINFNGNLKNYYLQFWFRKGTTSIYSSYNDTIFVGVCDDPDHIKQVEVIGYAVNTTTDYKQVKVQFTKSSKSDGYIVLLAAADLTAPFASQYAQFYVDDIELVQSLPCATPYDLVASNVSSDAADLAWGGTSAAYKVYLSNEATDKPDTVTNWLRTIDASTNALSLTGLTPNTRYYVYVQGNCTSEGKGESEFSTGISFKTECVAVTPEQLGIVSFEESEGFVTGSGKMENCWTVGNLQAPTNTSYIPYVYDDYGRTGDNCLKILAYDYSSADSAYAVLPEINYGDKTIQDYMLNFYFRQASTSSYSSYDYNDTLYVGIVQDPSDLSSLEIIGSVGNATTDYVKAEIDLGQYQGTNGYIVLLAAADQSSSAYYNYGSFYVDDIQLQEKKACATPTGLALDTVTTDSVAFHWDNVAPNYNAYVIDHVVLPDTVQNWPFSAAVSDSVVGFAGLTPATVYYAYVKSDCGASGESNFSDAMQFQTECVPLAVPFEKDFGDGETSLPICWEVTKASGSYPSVSSYSHSLYFYGGSTEQIVALPELNKPLNQLTLNMRYKAESSSSYTYGKLKVGYYKSLDSAFVEVAALDYTSDTTDYELILTDVPADARYLAIAYNGGNVSYGSAYVRSIKLSETPACLPIKSISFQNISRREMDIQWTPKKPADGYQLVISPDKKDDAALESAEKINVADTTGYHASGLERDTQYFVYVRSNCGAADGVSEWVCDSVQTKAIGPDCHSTAPGEISISGDGSQFAPIGSYYNNSYAEQLYTAEEMQAAGLHAGYLSKVSFKYILSNSYTKNVTLYVGTTTDTQVSTNFYKPEQAAAEQSITFNTADKWYDIELDEPFYWDGTSNLIIGVRSMASAYWSNGTAGFAAGETTNNTVVYNRSDSSDPRSYYSSGTASNNRPDVQLTICPMGVACPAVDTVYAELLGNGTSSAKFTWPAAGGDYANTYEFCYTTDAEAQPDTIGSKYTLDTLGITLSDLTADTQYYGYVRCNCNGESHDDGNSNWFKVAFHTNADCPVVANLSATVTGKTSAEANWDVAFAEQEKTFYYVLATEEMDAAALAAASLTEVDTNYLALSGLTTSQTYHLYVASKCGESKSAFEHVSFTQPDQCTPVDEVHVTDSTAYTVTLAWTQNQFGEETQWEAGIVGQEQNAKIVSTPTAVLFGLTPETEYTAYVKAVCGATESSSLQTVSFHTTAVPSDEQQIGSGTGSSYYLPTYMNYKYTTSEQIYTAAEMGRAGTITSVAFNNTKTYTPSRQLVVYLKAVSDDAFSSTSDWKSLSADDTVYNGTYTFAAGWNTITLSKPFDYNGTDNLLLVVDDNTGSYTGSYPYFATFQANSYQALYSYSDNSNVDPTNPGTTTGYRYYSKNQVKFGFLPEDCPSVSALAVSDVNNAKVASWYPGAGETRWNTYLSQTELTDAELAAVTADTVLDINKKLENLENDADYYFYVRPICSAESFGSWKMVHFISEATCKVPAELSADSIGSYAVKVSWKKPSSAIQSYKVAFGKASEVDWADEATYSVVETTDTIALLSGLDGNTDYKARVRAICSESDESRWTAEISFTTACGVISRFPWLEDFDALTSGIPSCWDNSQGTTTTESYKWNASTGGVDGTGCLKFDSYSNRYGTDTLATPTFNLTSNMVLTFQAKNAAGGEFKVMIAQDGGAKTDLLTVGTPSDWTEFEADLSDYTGHEVVVYFCSTSNYGSTGAYHYLDNVKVAAAPTCFKPSQIHVIDSLATTSSATVAWSAPAQGGSQYVVSVISGLDTLINKALVNDTFLVVSNLSAGKTYSFNVEVATYCGGTDTSAVVTKTVQATTECEVISSFPWMEDFDALTSGIPACWDNSQGTTTTESYKWNASTGGVDGTECLKFDSYNNNRGTDTLATPTFNLTSNLVLTFQAKNPKGGEFKVMIAQDGGAKTDLLTVGNPSDWTEFEADLSDYTGHEVVVYFCSTSNYGSTGAYHYLDNVKIALLPTCSKPTDITAGDAGLHSVVIRWNSAAENDSVLVKNGDEVLFENIVAGVDTLKLEGLNSSTQYSLSVSVQALCSETDHSEVVTKTVSFSTECEAISTFPWTEGFENYATGSFNNVPCYSTESLVGSANDWQVYSSSYSAHTGNNCAYITYTSSTAGRTVGALNLPEFNLQTGKRYVFSYWLKGSSSSSTDTICVYVNDSLYQKYNSRTWGGNFKKDSIFIDGSDDLTNIQFTYSNQDGYSIYLDDIELDVVKYRVIFKYDADSVLEIDTVAYGEIPVFQGDAPTKEGASEGKQYVFKGWDPTLTAVVAEAIYTAVFVEEDIPTWLDNAAAEQKVVKFIKDNKLFIRKDGVLYDAAGRKVK